MHTWYKIYGYFEFQFFTYHLSSVVHSATFKCLFSTIASLQVLIIHQTHIVQCPHCRHRFPLYQCTAPWASCQPCLHKRLVSQYNCHIILPIKRKVGRMLITNIFKVALPSPETESQSSLFEIQMYTFTNTFNSFLLQIVLLIYKFLFNPYCDRTRSNKSLPQLQRLVSLYIHAGCANFSLILRFPKLIMDIARIESRHVHLRNSAG